MDCPCGTKTPYANCCAIAHESIANVSTAEQLMRSRYTAFTRGDGDYLMNSHHSSTRPLSEKKDMVRWANSVMWVGLEIIAKSKGLKGDTEGIIEFNAHLLENGKPRIIHERSKFIKENGLWMYLGLA